MRLRSKGTDKPRIDNELESDDQVVWKLSKTDQGYSIGNKKEASPTPVAQTSITFRKTPEHQ